MIVDRDIRGLIEQGIVIIQSSSENQPFNRDKQIGTASIDLRLSSYMLKYKPGITVIDISQESDDADFEPVPVIGGEIEIQPGEVIMALSLEIVVLPPNIAGILTGRTSVARRGLGVEISQNLIQPGHSQQVPLQLTNHTNRPIKLRPFIPICQLSLYYTSSLAERPYGTRLGDVYIHDLNKPYPPKSIQGFDPTGPLRIVSPNTLTPRERELQEQIETYRREVTDKAKKREEAKQDETQKNLSYILVFASVLAGAALSVCIGELDVKPFPSLKLIFAGAILLISVVIIVVAKWKG